MTTSPDIKPRSRDVTDGLEKAAARGMLRAVGLGDDDFAKPQIGVASSWNEITPCNLSLDRLAKAVKDGVHAGGGYPLEFGTISVSDGISMGHEGMHFSLVSREVIADSVETVMNAERLDGSVLLAGCDKSLPGMLMAAARLDLSSVFLYAGSILPGIAKMSDGSERTVTIIDAFEAIGACSRGLMSRADVDAIERAICPGEGACGGMYTANTMASVAEAIGMSLPGSAAPPATDRRRDGFARKSGEAVVELLRRGITARDIMTKEAFENAIAVVMAFGGSTNAVLHLLAIAHEADVDLTLEDFRRVGAKVPHLADVKPFGSYVMTDVDRVGGVPVVMRALLDAGLLHGDCLTVTGRTMAENLADIAPPDVDGKVLRAMGEPIHATGGITILTGSLAPEGAVVKSAGFDSDVFEGTARVFDGERLAMDALEDGSLACRRRRRHPLRGAQGRARACARCSPSPGRSRVRASARTSSSSPTAGSRVAPPACASATSLPRRSTRGRSPSSATVTRSASTSRTAPSTCSSTTRRWSAGGPRASPTPRPSTPAGCSRSTASSSAARVPGPCVTDPTGEGPALELIGLVKEFRGRRVVHELSLTVPRGSLFGLVGPNGAGKTTTLSMATGLLRPDGGVARVLGHDVWADPAAAKAVMGVSPDGLRLFEQLSGRELLHYVGDLRRMPVEVSRQRAEELLTVLDLADDASTVVADYSAGMVKKVSLAAALIHAPRLLVLDEPFEAVDPVSGQAIRTILRRYVATGGTVVMSSHVMELVEGLCDRVAVVAAGRVLADDTVGALTSGGSLHQRFLELVGAAEIAGDGLTWLGG